MAKRRQNPRARQLGAIHIKAQKLGMIDKGSDSDAYHDMLWAIAQVKSARDLDAWQRHKVLDHLSKLEGKTSNSKPSYPGRPNNMDIHLFSDQKKKIEALLADAGKPWSYALAMAKRMTGKDRLEFCSPADLDKLIAALSIQQRREIRRGKANPGKPRIMTFFLQGGNIKDAWMVKRGENGWQAIPRSQVKLLKDSETHIQLAVPEWLVSQNHLVSAEVDFDWGEEQS